MIKNLLIPFDMDPRKTTRFEIDKSSYHINDECFYHNYNLKGFCYYNYYIMKTNIMVVFYTEESVF